MGGEKPGLDETVPASRESQPIELQVGGAIGRYRIESRIGAGAMGIVWCARDPQLDRKVAIKVVHPNLARSAEASNRLLREARAMAKLSHRAVVTVHDAGEVEGRLFLAMELVDGTSLGQMLRARTPQERRDWRRWLAMMLEAGRGLEAAHGAGVLHRDFKPDNVLVDAKGRVCVADFGLATLGESDRPVPVGERASKQRLLELTTTGALLGTPAYMSPQQLRGEALDERADQFNFCVATYEALYGRRPFEPSGLGLDMTEMIALLEASIEHADLQPPPGDALVPDEVRDVLRRGLAASPADRWPNMTALLDALERAARSTRRTTSHAVPSPRRLIVLVGIAAAALAIVAIVAIVLLRADPPAGRTPPVAKRLFDVSLKTKIALTRDGKRLALGSDRIEVRELDGTRTWTTPLRIKDDITTIEITDDYVKFGIRAVGAPRRWNYGTDGELLVPSEPAPGVWSGETLAGDVYYAAVPAPHIAIVAAGKEVQRWPATTSVEFIAISPDRKRVASLEADRFVGRIVIRDVTRDHVIRGPELASPTTIAWADDETLVYATGTTEQPRIHRVAVRDDGLGPPVEIYGRDHGWFGDLAIAKGRMVFVEMNPRSRARLVDGEITRELDSANVAVALGWLADGDLLTWSRSNRRVERRALDGELRPTDITLAAEPANATVADDIVIAAIRSTHGRAVVAHSLSTGALVWSHAPPSTLAVRCAGDLHPPCFAVRSAPGGVDQVVPIDVATGRMDDRVLAEGAIEDVAVAEAGDRILVAMRGAEVHELAPDGTRLAVHATPLASVRSVAYVQRGGFLVAGTLVRNTFQVGRVLDGKFTLVSQAENDLLSLVRPTRDGARVLILSRVYAPVLWELALP